MTKSVVAAAFAALLLSATPANALTSFTISGDFSAAFTLPDSPVVDPADAVDGITFGVRGVPDFATSSNGIGDIAFFSAAAGGGLIIVDNGNGFDWLLDATDGQQYYTGSEVAPTFLPGTYTLAGLGTPGSFTLTIASAPDAVPEPATWAMMIGGFALAGAAMRQRRTALRFA